MLLTLNMSVVETGQRSHRGFILFVRIILQGKIGLWADHINQKRFLHFCQNNLVRENKSVVEPDHINKKGFIAFKDFRLTKQPMSLVSFCCLILLFFKLNGKSFSWFVYCRKNEV